MWSFSTKSKIWKMVLWVFSWVSKDQNSHFSFFPSNNSNYKLTTAEPRKSKINKTIKKKKNSRIDVEKKIGWVIRKRGKVGWWEKACDWKKSPSSYGHLKSKLKKITALFIYLFLPESNLFIDSLKGSFQVTPPRFYFFSRAKLNFFFS